jgi:hypothetical protein
LGRRDYSADVVVDMDVDLVVVLDADVVAVVFVNDSAVCPAGRVQEHDSDYVSVHD